MKITSKQQTFRIIVGERMDYIHPIHLCAKHQITDWHPPLKKENKRLFCKELDLPLVFYKDPACKICKYYSIFKHPEHLFVHSPERWEYARDECGITICLNHISLYLLRDKRRMVYETHVGEAQRVGRPLLPTYFCDINGTLVHRSTKGSKNYWKHCERRRINGRGH